MRATASTRSSHAPAPAQNVFARSNVRHEHAVLHGAGAACLAREGLAVGHVLRELGGVLAVGVRAGAVGGPPFAGRGQPKVTTVLFCLTL
jgi:hypothetical protein